MRKQFIIGIAAVFFILALLPPTPSLYQLTGEEELLPQLRGLIHWWHSALRPQPDLAPTAAIHHPRPSPYGVNTFLEQEALPEVRAESLRLIRAAGFHFIRQPFPWYDIEVHAKGDFVDRRNDPNGVDAWAKYDNIVSLAEEYGIEIIARLDKPPAWTRANPPEVTGSDAPPDNFADYGDFVAAVAERYRGRIHTYQLWNEPNGNEEWGIDRPVNAEQYTQLLCLAYGRIKKVDPNATVLAGALTPTVALDHRNLNDLIYLQRMYTAGAAACFDIFSAQGYGLWSGPTDQRLRPTIINYPHLLYLRDVMVQNGDAAKPLWISEMGWNAVPPDSGIPANFGQVTEAQQARYAVEAYQRLQAEWPWAGVGNYWFFKRATDSETNQPFYYFRMLEPDFTPLPVYSALRDFAAAAPVIQPRPLFFYWWQQARPILALLSGAVLFFSLLNLLLPHDWEAA